MRFDKNEAGLRSTCFDLVGVICELIDRNRPFDPSAPFASFGRLHRQVSLLNELSYLESHGRRKFKKQIDRIENRFDENSNVRCLLVFSQRVLLSVLKQIVSDARVYHSICCNDNYQFTQERCKRFGKVSDFDRLKSLNFQVFDHENESVLLDLTNSVFCSWIDFDDVDICIAVSSSFGSVFDEISKCFPKSLPLPPSYGRLSEELDSLICDIPSEFRSIPISKKKAALLLGRHNEDSGVESISKAIEDGSLACEEFSRQSFVFDIRQFPECVHSHLLPHAASKENSR
jgi:hypothetical protein